MMIELETWQARPSTPPAAALLKELLAGTGPAIYRVGGKFYVDEVEADRWLSRRRMRPDEAVRPKPTFPRTGRGPTAAEIEKLYGRATDDMRVGLKGFQREMELTTD
jgi:hypothetical protein